MGIEPTACALATHRSTFELRPQNLDAGGGIEPLIQGVKVPCPTIRRSGKNFGGERGIEPHSNIPHVYGYSAPCHTPQNLLVGGRGYDPRILRPERSVIPASPLSQNKNPILFWMGSVCFS